MTAFASLFISHGAPTLPITDIPARTFLRELGLRLARPRAIVVLSPHWTTPRLEVKSPVRFATWPDFHGFPEALHRSFAHGSLSMACYGFSP